jgi:hypothetical protein
MDNFTTIRLELGIDARRFIQQVQVHNELIEDQIAKGIELALNDLSENDNFIQAVRESTKRELINLTSSHIFSYELKKKIEEAIREKVAKKISEYSDRIGEKIEGVFNEINNG